MVEDYIIYPNPDFIFRKKIEEEIKNNDGFCLNCTEHTEETKCPCVEFKNQKSAGWCKCKQFFKIINTKKICLCGSTKFKEQFLKVAHDLTLDGYIVTMPNIFIHSDNEQISQEELNYLNEIQLAKIVDADIIYVINYNGYIGESTYKEIQWALQLGKTIKYLENINEEKKEL